MRNSPSGEDVTGDTLSFQVVFSEAVQNVTADDFVLSGAVIDDASAEGGSITIDSVSGSGTTYIVNVSGLTPHDGDLTLAVRPGSNIASVRTGNALPEDPTPTGDTESFTVGTPPQLTGVGLNAIVLDSNDLDGQDSYTFRLTFNEAMTGIDAADFDFSLLAPDGTVLPENDDWYLTTNGGVAVGTYTGTNLSVSQINNSTYDVTVTGLERSGNVTLELSLANGYSINDAAGNNLANLDLAATGASTLVDNILVFVRTTNGGVGDPVLETETNAANYGQFTLYRTSNAIGQGQTFAEFTLGGIGTAQNDIIYGGYYADYRLLDGNGNLISPFATDITGSNILVDTDGTTAFRDIEQGVIINGYQDPRPFYSYLAVFDDTEDTIALNIQPIDESAYAGIGDSYLDDAFIEDIEPIILQLLDQGPLNELS